MDIRQVMAGRQEPQNLNLVNPIKVDTFGSAAKPAGFYQLIILGVLGVVFAFLVSYAYGRYLLVGLSPWIVFAALACFIACSTLHAFLNKKFVHRVGFLALETIALLAPLWRFDLRLLAAAAVAIFILLLWGYHESRSELDYGTEVRFFKVTHAVTGKIVTTTLLFMIFFYILISGSAGNFFLNQENFTVFFDRGSALFNGFYPSILISGSFRDFVQGVAQEQLSATPAFSTLAPTAQATALEAEVTALTGNFSKTLGVSITGASTMSSVLYDFIVQTLRNWHEHFGKWFIVGWALALFIILRSVGVIFVLVFQFFSMIVYELLLAIGIMKIVEHPQTKEEVEFT